MDIVILAGGFGTRLQTVLEEGIPKPLAPVNGKPFLWHLMSYAARFSPTRFILSVHYGAPKIKEAIGASFEGIPVVYAQEDRPLGTGGAMVYACQEAAVDAPCLVLNGDTFCQVDFGALYEWGKHHEMTVLLRHVDDVARYGACVVDEKSGRLNGFEEKGTLGRGWINAGVYVINPTVLRHHGPQGPFSFEEKILHTKPDLFYAYKYSDYFIDIGVPADYKIFQEYVVGVQKAQAN